MQERCGGRYKGEEEGRTASIELHESYGQDDAVIRFRIPRFVNILLGPNLFEDSSSSVSLPRPKSVSAMRMMLDSKDTTNKDLLGPTVPTL